MRIFRWIVCALAVACLAAARTPAASPRDSLLVSTSWLGDHLSDPNLVLLHIGDKAEYDVTHIRGARFVTLADVSVSDREHKGNGLSLEMPANEDLRLRLMNLGISDTSRIVVYFGKDSVTSTTRVMFTLDYAGLGDHASMLDGGMPAWIRDRHEVTNVVTPNRMGTLAPLKTKATVVNAEYVLAHLNTPHVAIVDGRSPAFYSGAQTGGSTEYPQKTGHIAGAKNVPYTEITDATSAVKSQDALAALFADAGVKPGDTIIGYCHIGQQATAILFAARSLGYSVLLYDGSFEDWSTHGNYPVETTMTIKKDRR